MKPEPPWGDARPLAGCEVIRAPDTVRPTRPRPGKKSPPAVVTKLRALNRFLDGTARTLHPSAALVWLQLLRDERDGTACAAVTDLARRCGLSPRTVKRRLAELKEAGLIEVVQGGSQDTGPTVYTVRPVALRR